MLVGNKSDLNNRAVSTEAAKAFAEKNSLLFIETSALEAVNVDMSFQTILGEIFKLTSTKSLENEGFKKVGGGKNIVVAPTSTPTEGSKGNCC